MLAYLDTGTILFIDLFKMQELDSRIGITGLIGCVFVIDVATLLSTKTRVFTFPHGLDVEGNRVKNTPRPWPCSQETLSTERDRQETNTLTNKCIYLHMGLSLLKNGNVV